MIECLETLVAAGHLTRGQSDELGEFYRETVASYQRLGHAAPHRQAQADLADLLEAEAAQQTRRAYLAADVRARIEQEMAGRRGLTGDRGRTAYLLDILENNDAGITSVEGRKNAIIGMAHADMEEVLHQFRRTAVTGRRRGRARMDAVVRELFGERTMDEAAGALADAWRRVSGDLRRRFNAAGGAVGELKDWGLPQIHDARALRRAGLAQWKQTIMPLLAPERMRHPLTGQPMTAAQLDRALDHIYEQIRTDGWANRDPSAQSTGRGSLARQHADHRFLVFRNADAWLAYQRDFGNPMPFVAMMDYVNTMARDIAALEVLGPNPNATLEWMRQTVQREAHLTDDQGAVNRARIATWRSEAMWEAIRGASNTPVNERLGNFMSGLRNTITASRLDRAMLSAISDVGFGKAARAFAGVPMARFASDLVGAMRQSGRREAVRAGLILDNAMHVLHAQARYAGTLSGPGWTQVLPDRILTWTGLTPYTQAGRHAFGLGFMAEVADRRALPFDELPGALRRTFERHGLSEADWNIIRRADPQTPEGSAGLLRPVDVARLGQLDLLPLIARDLIEPGAGGNVRTIYNELMVLIDRLERLIRDSYSGREFQGSRNRGDVTDAMFTMGQRIAELRDRYRDLGGQTHAYTDFGENTPRPGRPEDIDFDRLRGEWQTSLRDVGERYLQMILAETEYAVPSGNVRSQALLQGQTRSGTFWGEMSRNFAQFKSFGVTVLMLHAGRTASEVMHGSIARGAAYGGGLLIATTMLGAGALQLKQVAAGKDLLPMGEDGDEEQRAFWAAALLQGGGLGIYGDFFFSDVNRYGNGLAATLVGPAAETADNVRKLTIGNFLEYAQGGDTNVGREVSDFARRELPGGLWWMGPAWERVVMDQLQHLADPEASAAFRRKVRFSRREFGQGYWWAPGEVAPDRAPQTAQ
ncbi:MAG: hypothetical protein AAFQ35_12730 [Pseudomonadota bacterium]